MGGWRLERGGREYTKESRAVRANVSCLPGTPSPVSPPPTPSQHLGGSEFAPLEIKRIPNSDQSQ